MEPQLSFKECMGKLRHIQTIKQSAIKGHNNMDKFYKVLRWVKEASFKRSHAIWYLLLNIMEKNKTIGMECLISSDSWVKVRGQGWISQQRDSTKGMMWRGRNCWVNKLIVLVVPWIQKCAKFIKFYIKKELIVLYANFKTNKCTTS